MTRLLSTYDVFDDGNVPQGEGHFVELSASYNPYGSITQKIIQIDASSVSLSQTANYESDRTRTQITHEEMRDLMRVYRRWEKAHKKFLERQARAVAAKEKEEEEEEEEVVRTSLTQTRSFDLGRAIRHAVEEKW